VLLIPVGASAQTPENASQLEAVIATTKGDITIRFFPKEAPRHVAHFVETARKGGFDGTTFFRAIAYAIVQGGDPLSKDPKKKALYGTGGPGYQIKCETSGNPHKHSIGALSMAHAGKDTGGSQFFMVLSEENTRHLNGVHTVFGQITSGLDVMSKIQKNDVMNSVRVA